MRHYDSLLRKAKTIIYNIHKSSCRRWCINLDHQQNKIAHSPLVNPVIFSKTHKVGNIGISYVLMYSKIFFKDSGNVGNVEEQNKFSKKVTSSVD